MIAWKLILLIIGICIIFFGSIILTVYLVKRLNKKRFRVIIFNKTQREVHKFSHLEETFTIGKNTYKYRQNKVVNTKLRDYLYYNFGQSEPIDVKTGESGNIDSKTLKTLMDTKLIKDLFSSSVDEMFSPSMIVMYVVLILNVIILIVMLVKGSAGVVLAGEVNKEFIKNAVLEAIK